MDEQKITDVIRMIEDSVKRNDEINKRLTKAIIVMAICFAVTVTSICGFYFFADYTTYPDVEQQIENGKASQSIGGDVE
jgi:hypothetical protein